MGCMLSRMKHYPNTCNPDDVLKTQQDNQANLLYTDVQANGEYPNYFNKFIAENNISLKITDADLAIIKQYPVDYISFSYYMSLLSSTEPEGKTTNGNLMNSLKILI